ncbi:unnamed protein product [Symbiodinium sp. KB8]|nr:unnamed protein product [Symbiodinium sp. KB8]
MSPSSSAVTLAVPRLPGLRELAACAVGVPPVWRKSWGLFPSRARSGPPWAGT